MPIYEYRCENCGQINEVFQKGLELEAPIACSNCGSIKLTKLISAPAMVKAEDSSIKGTTCCGRTERCDTPPCSTDGVCRRDE
ncbi:MAG TPA: zinc ribbon domain-containing protein [bacterium (Candidatus Stahlbacteria)]|nr:zinc ribbon domain-containing protein [Candidatus Stahlbacteria bacterium]